MMYNYLIQQQNNVVNNRSFRDNTENEEMILKYHLVYTVGFRYSRLAYRRKE
jgi:hypothetical protein